MAGFFDAAALLDLAARFDAGADVVFFFIPILGIVVPNMGIVKCSTLKGGASSERPNTREDKHWRGFQGRNGWNGKLGGDFMNYAGLALTMLFEPDL